ncbi:MAG: SDR family oxidoreductase [Cyanobacteriota/Melainabacteria group bacterium]
MLKELLADADIKTIYCLVRAKDPASALKRIDSALSKQGLPILRWRQQGVCPVLGDLSKPGLGLAAGREWGGFAGEIDTIYHCGAMVNMVLPYDDLKKHQS